MSSYDSPGAPSSRRIEAERRRVVGFLMERRTTPEMRTAMEAQMQTKTQVR